MFLFPSFLQKWLLPNTRHLHSSAEFVCLVLESVVGEAFLLIFSVAGLLLYEKSSILEGLSLGVELDSPVSRDLRDEVGHVINNSKELLHLIGTCELI